MGFIGKDRSNENTASWFTTAPTAEQEAQQDTVTTYDVTYSSDGIARCYGSDSMDGDGD